MTMRPKVWLLLGFLLSAGAAADLRAQATIDEVVQAINRSVGNSDAAGFCICQLRAAIWGEYNASAQVAAEATRDRKPRLFQIKDRKFSEEIDPKPLGFPSLAAADRDGFVLIPTQQAAFAKGVPLFIGDAKFDTPTQFRYTVYSNPSASPQTAYAREETTIGSLHLQVIERPNPLSPSPQSQPRTYTLSSALSGKDKTYFSMVTMPSSNPCLASNEIYLELVNSPPTAVRLAAVSTPPQSAAAGTTLPDPLVVEVRDQFGNALPGVSVAFSATNGTVNPATANTDSSGRASTRLTLGPALGPVTVTARVGTLAPVTFSLTAAGAAVTSVSAASFSGALAPDALATAYGQGLATATSQATSLPLPTSLAGTTLKVTDSLGFSRLAPLFFVSPAQINYLVPTGTTPGQATITVASGDGKVSEGKSQIDRVAPALFSANFDGRGVAAALAIRVSGGAQEPIQVFRFEEAQKRNVPVPIDLGSESDQVILLLFGTGIRYASSPAAVKATIGDQNAEVLYAGPQPDSAGLDQVNVRLPSALRGRGEVNIVLTVDGKTANTVTVTVGP